MQGEHIGVNVRDQWGSGRPQGERPSHTWSRFPPRFVVWEGVPLAGALASPTASLLAYVNAYGRDPCSLPVSYHNIYEYVSSSAFTPLRTHEDF